MHKQFDKSRATLYFVLNCELIQFFMTQCIRWRKVGMHKQFDQLQATVNLRTVWHLWSLFWPSHPLLVNDDNIDDDDDDDKEDENYDDSDDDSDRPRYNVERVMMTIMTMVIAATTKTIMIAMMTMMTMMTMTWPQTKTQGGEGIQRPRSRCGTKLLPLPPGQVLCHPTCLTHVFVFFTFNCICVCIWIWIFVCIHICFDT